jgi:hypothetical protein
VISYEKYTEYRSRHRGYATYWETKVSWSDCRNVSAKGFRPPLGPTQPPVQWLLWKFSQRQSGRTQTNHSPPSGTEVKNEWSYPTLPIRLHGVHRNNFVVNFVLQRSYSRWNGRAKTFTNSHAELRVCTAWEYFLLNCLDRRNIYGNGTG